MSKRFLIAQKYSRRLPRYTSYPPVPDWNGTPDEEAWLTSVAETVMTGEGISVYVHLPYCERLCTYCGCNKRITVNHNVEMPYVNDVLREWQRYREVLPDAPVLAELHLGGGTPTFFSAEALDTLLTGLLKNTRPAPRAAWSVEVHPSYTSADQLEVLFKHGFRRISIGVQSFNPKVQLLINRIQPIAEAEAITNIARGIGFDSINYDLLYGLPSQELDVVMSDVKQVLQQRPDRVAFYGYAHTPWKHPGQRRYTESDLPDARERFESAELGRELFESEGYVSIGMDHFALPTDELAIAAQQGRLHRNFMGYTEQQTDLLIGLGVSAISESPLGFVQNEKSIERYREKLDEGENLFINGHSFSIENKRVRRHILEIMCAMQTPMPNHRHFTNRELLEKLSMDGLIRIEGNRIEVLPGGNAFLRNVCAAIDPKQNNDPEQKRYSVNL